MVGRKGLSGSQQAVPYTSRRAGCRQAAEQDGQRSGGRPAGRPLARHSAAQRLSSTLHNALHEPVWSKNSICLNPITVCGLRCSRVSRSCTDRRFSVPEKPGRVAISHSPIQGTNEWRLIEPYKTLLSKTNIDDRLFHEPNFRIRRYRESHDWHCSGCQEICCTGVSPMSTY